MSSKASSIPKKILWVHLILKKILGILKKSHIFPYIFGKLSTQMFSFMGLWMNWLVTSIFDMTYNWPLLNTAPLTFFTPMSRFYTPWKRQKTQVFERYQGYRNRTLAWKGLIISVNHWFCMSMTSFWCTYC